MKTTECAVPMAWEIVDSPLTPIRIEASDKGLTRVEFIADPQNVTTIALPNSHTAQAKSELNAYFAKKLTVFSVPLDWQGTAFQQRVWQQLCHIKYGERCDYGTLAHAIGNPNASRAVGMANSKNTIAIIVPCHRVIGKNGSLTGYAGGLDKKQYLLDLERR